MTLWKLHQIVWHLWMIVLYLALSEEALQRGCSPFCKLPDDCDSQGNCVHGCLPGYTRPGCSKSCVKSKFGVDCNQTCSSNCRNSECHHATGHCLEGCTPGFIPPLCTTPCPSENHSRCEAMCSPNCRGAERCNVSTGKCLEGCKPGLEPPLCTTPCRRGVYGPGCQHRCSPNCAGTGLCDPTTGYCLQGCHAMFAPPRCEVELQCPPFKYGDDCKNTNCSEFCSGKGLCDVLTGDCVEGCLPGFYPPECRQVCKPFFHGENCTSPCNPLCRGTKECHHETGVCLDGFHTDAKVGSLAEVRSPCSWGWFGANCDRQCGHCKLMNYTKATWCSPANGRCLHGCVSGYTGPRCNTTRVDRVKSPTSSSTNVLGVVLLTGTMLGSVLLGIALIKYKCFSRRRARKSSSLTSGTEIEFVQGKDVLQLRKGRRPAATSISMTSALTSMETSPVGAGLSLSCPASGSSVDTAARGRDGPRPQQQRPDLLSYPQSQLFWY